MEKSRLPLLLLDNASMSTVLNDGEFKISSLSFVEAKAIVEMYDESEVLRCFSGDPLEQIVFDYLGVNGRHYPFKNITDMRAGQDAIVFKVLATFSESQPVIETKYNTEAKKIQNLYVYCQYITRLA